MAIDQWKTWQTKNTMTFHAKKVLFQFLSKQDGINELNIPLFLFSFFFLLKLVAKQLFLKRKQHKPTGHDSLFVSNKIFLSASFLIVCLCYKAVRPIIGTTV